MSKSTRRIRRKSDEPEVHKPVIPPAITKLPLLSSKQLELSMEQCSVVSNIIIEGNNGEKKDVIQSTVKQPRQLSRLDELRKKAIKYNELRNFKQLMLRMKYPYPNSKPTEVFEESHCPCCYQLMFDVAENISDIRHTLTCGHQLHSECLVKWFSVKESHGVCPICRTSCH